MTQRLILAPLLGVTGQVFRRVFSRRFGGFDQALAPFIAVTHGKQPPRSHFKDIDPVNNVGSLPLIPQLIGKDGQDFNETARRIHGEFGYAEVNWNIGCPAGTVTSRQRGAGMLPHPELIDAFLEAACRDLPCRLSVKMRLGMERPDEYLALVPVLNRYPIGEITIHPRTGRQQYSGQADVERFADLKSRLTHPVVYNGDLRSAARAAAIAGRFPDLSGIMIGRGSVINPWLTQAIREGRDERELFSLAGLRTFHDELLEAYIAAIQGGNLPVLGKMKEIWTYWEDHFPDGERPVRNILKSARLDEYRRNVERAFALGGA
jgi:tRNA-dihydrouridine synthase